MLAHDLRDQIGNELVLVAISVNTRVRWVVRHYGFMVRAELARIRRVALDVFKHGFEVENGEATILAGFPALVRQVHSYSFELVLPVRLAGVLQPIHREVGFVFSGYERRATWISGVVTPHLTADSAYVVVTWDQVSRHWRPIRAPCMVRQRSSSCRD